MTVANAQQNDVLERDAVSRSTAARIFYEHGLSIVMFSIFLVCWALQIVFGLRAYNEEHQQHGQAIVTLAKYLSSGHFIEATAENWESEFLQMAAFVWLTSFLFQKGSPESNAPYHKEPDPPVQKDSPWPVHKGGWVLAIYARSLTIAFVLMFLVSFLMHAYGGARLYSEEQVEHGQASVSMLQFMGTSPFWFESFQNWQSEFLSIFAMVVLAIFLRQKDSPESKPVTAPHHVNE